MLAKLGAFLDKLGHYTQQPQTWAAIAVVLAVAGGGRGRRAALRGGICYGATAAVVNFFLKPLVERRRPSGAGEEELGPVTSSFPSGHAAADLAFTFGAAQELPALLVPLSAATFPAHWSLVRSNGHHTSDVLLGGFVGLAVTWGMAKLWPVTPENDDDTDSSDPDGGAPEGAAGQRGGVSSFASGSEPQEQRPRRELRSLWTEVDGRRYHARVPVEQEPNGPDVVLVHGYGVSSRNMVPTAEALAPHCRVYAPDLPGHGLSYKPSRTLDLPSLAEALAQWMTSVGLQRACLLGNSYGAQISVELALRHPERVDCLILQAPTVDPTARNLPRQLARRVRSGWRERHESDPADDKTSQDWREIGLRRMVQDARYALRDRIEDKLPRIGMPTLVVRGSRDPIVPQRWAEEATALIPRGRLVVLPDAIHTITFTRPDQLVAAILPFLEETADEERRSEDTRA